MALDFESTAGNIVSDAAAGFGVGGPVGAAVGGAAGLIQSLFSKKKTPSFTDPYLAQSQILLSQMMQSHTGRDAAAATARGEQVMAQEAAERARNTPGLAGNPSALAGITNRYLRESEAGAQRAFTQGAEIDAEQRARAGSLASDLSRRSLDVQQLNQAYADRPTFGQQMLSQVLPYAAGIGIQKFLSPGQPTTPKAEQPTAAQNYLSQYGTSGLFNKLYAPAPTEAASQNPAPSTPSDMSRLNMTDTMPDYYTTLFPKLYGQRKYSLVNPDWRSSMGFSTDVAP